MATEADGPPCAVRSLSLDEPLAGTASRIASWLLVEQPGGWGHDALAESGFPPEVGRWLRDRGRDLRIRTLLVKRRDRPRSELRRCYVASSRIAAPLLRAFEVPDPEELLRLDLEAVASGRIEGIGEPVAGPLVLVCTHGRHDACCAREGGPVARILAGMPDVWESTHVGGDRFAGNLVCLPHGVYLGRVRPHEAEGIVRAYRSGVIDLKHHRGRSSYPPAVQAAEHALRVRLGLAGLDDLVLVEHRRGPGDRHIVAFEDPAGRRHVEEVEVGRLPERLVTCKATEPHRPRSFAVRDA